MSRQSGRRRPPRHRPHQGHIASSGTGPDPWAELADLLACEDPVAAEVWASSMLAPLLSEPSPTAGGTAKRQASPQALIDSLVASSRVEALGLLHGIAAVAPLRLADRAQRGVAKLRRRGVVGPDWLEFIGTARPTTSHVLRHPLDDGVSVFMGFAYPNGVEHTVAAYIDHNLGFIVKDVFVGGSLDEVAALVASEGDHTLFFEQIHAAEARARIEQGLFELDRTWQPPVSEDVLLKRALLEARLALLPAGGVPPERVRPGEEEITELRDEFLTSPEAARLPETGDVADIAAMLTRYEADYGTGNPLRWSPVVAELCLADWFPRKVLADRAYFEQVPAVAEAWARFTFRKRGLEDLAADTIGAVRRWSDEMLSSLNDESRWGPGKQIASAMAEADVDVGDPEAVQDWIDAYNAGLRDEADGDDDDEILAAWEEVDAQAVGLLRRALQSLQGEPPPHKELTAAAAALRSGYEVRRRPFDIMANALDYGDIPAYDTEVVVEAAGALIALGDPTGLEPEDESLVASLEHSDWLGAVLEAVRAGPGSPLDASLLAGYVDKCPEVDGGPEDDAEFVEAAFEIVLPTWQAAGMVAGGRLTELGAWVLPRALAAAWGGTFD